MVPPHHCGERRVLHPVPHPRIIRNHFIEQCLQLTGWSKRYRHWVAPLLFPSCCSLVARVPTSPPHLPPPHPGGSDFGAQGGPFYTIVSTLPRVPWLRSGFRVVYNRRSELVRHWHTAEVGCGPRRASLDLRRWSAFVLDSAELDRRKWFSLKPGPCRSGGTGDERVVRDLAADQPGV